MTIFFKGGGANARLGWSDFHFFLKDIENEGGWLFQIFRFLDLLASMAKTMI